MKSYLAKLNPDSKENGALYKIKTECGRAIIQCNVHNVTFVNVKAFLKSFICVLTLMFCEYIMQFLTSNQIIVSFTAMS